jgi:putative membrane-bound dehydrogenase-like protein
MITKNIPFKSFIYFALLVSVVHSCKDGTPQKHGEFQIHPDFKIELIATEPVIFDPVDMEFDEFGNAYVLEMPGYPFEDEQSRLILLQDLDKDGVFDNRQVFADHLQLASSILPYKKGILVAAPPYLLHISDRDGDMVAETRDTLMSGWSTGNLQHNYNGLTIGLDGWIYIANGGNSGHPYWWPDSLSKIDLRGDDVRINLTDRRMERLGESSGGFELGIDEWGHIFETHNLEHISQLVFPDRYINVDGLNVAHALTNISDHEENGLSRIYPIGEQESRVNHPEQSGYFSGACGITYYGGGAFGSEFENTVWVADVVLNLIHVDKLGADGPAFKASRILEKKDFLASTDRSFRPVNMTVGPDGAIYMLDMHRDVIEHPEWIPDDIEAQVDIDAGKNKGRIYRIMHKTPSIQKFSFSDFQRTVGMIQSLDHPNQWVRNTAHRLLLESNLGEEEILLLNENLNSENPFVRLHSLWILHLKGELSKEKLINAMNDPTSGVAENAMVISESYFGNYPEFISALVDKLGSDDDRLVMQAALSLSTIDVSLMTNRRNEVLAKIGSISKKPIDEWLIAALSLAISDYPAMAFHSIIDKTNMDQNIEMLKAFAGVAASQENELLDILKSLNTAQLAQGQKAKIITVLGANAGILKGKIKSVSSIEILEKEADLDLLAALAKLRKTLGLPVSNLYRQKSKTALVELADHEQSEEKLLANLAVVDLLPYVEKSEALFSLLSNKLPIKIQEEALRQIWESQHENIGTRLVAAWNSLGPNARRYAGDILLYKKQNHDALLTGLEDGTINIGEMNFDLERRRTLLWWTDDENTKKRAEALFSDSGVVNRQDAIDEMKVALKLTGSVEEGQTVFDQLCSQCHIYGKTGQDVGPVLTEISRKSKETLIHEILDPNAAVDTKYINHKVETQDGQLHVGMVHAETDHDVTIKKIGGATATILKKEIKNFTSLGTSLMMEGLEANMTHQEMADLLAFLQQPIQ